MIFILSVGPLDHTMATTLTIQTNVTEDNKNDLLIMLRDCASNAIGGTEKVETTHIQIQLNKEFTEATVTLYLTFSQHRQVETAWGDSSKIVSTIASAMSNITSNASLGIKVMQATPLSTGGFEGENIDE